MPRELFDAVSHRVQAATRTRYSMPCSVALHVLVLGALAIVSIVTSEVLPDPMANIVWASAPDLPKVVTTPPPPRQTVAAANPAAAPVSVPEGIRPESGLEPQPSETVGDQLGVDVGLVDGVPSGFGDLGEVDREPPPPPPPAKPIPVGGHIRPPQKIEHVNPVYPEIAQRAHIEGIVIIEAIVGSDGRVEQERVLRSIPMLDEAAVNAVRQWRYTPTLLNGVPVSIIMTVSVRFTLK